MAQLQFLWSSTVGYVQRQRESVTWQAPRAVHHAGRRHAPARGRRALRAADRSDRVRAPRVEQRHAQAARLLEGSWRHVAPVPARLRRLEHPGRCVRHAELRAWLLRHGRTRPMRWPSIARGSGWCRRLVGAAAVTVNFGGVCPFRARPGDACAQVPVVWDSIESQYRCTGRRPAAPIRWRPSTFAAARSGGCAIVS